MKILIHHHSQVYNNGSSLFTQSFIGLWLNELSKYFSVGYIAHESDTKDLKQDVLITQDIKFHSLGSLKKISRSRRNKNIQNILKEVIDDYDYLIIRGITPRQYILWKAVDPKKVIFLFVGSLYDSKVTFSLFDITKWFFYKLRIWQLSKIVKESKILANSPGSCMEIMKKYNKRCEFLPTNTIKHEQLSDSFLPRENVEKIIFCGRLVSEKGIFELIEAHQELLRRGYNLKLELIGEVENNSELHEIIARKYKGTLINVSFTGFIGFGDELLIKYKTSDIFILPSYHEGFPHAIWEAASQGVCVMTTPVGGIPSVVSSDHVEFIRVRSSESIVEKMEYLISNFERRKLMTANLGIKLFDNTLEKSATALKDYIFRQNRV